MKFKTTIEIISEAENKNEAMEIAGEYISGNIISGVDMKCLTRPVKGHVSYIVSSVAILSLVAICAFSTIASVRPHQSFISNISGACAVQTPLKTSAEAKKDEVFKKEWQDVHTREALNSLKSK